MLIKANGRLYLVDGSSSFSMSIAADINMCLTPGFDGTTRLNGSRRFSAIKVNTSLK